MTTSEPGFYAARTGALKREGILGKRVAVTLRAGRLGIVGEDGGAIWIDPADIASMRVGYDETRPGKIFHTTIVRASRPEPLALHPLTKYDPHYAATIRALAAAVAQAAGIGRITSGTSAFSAWFGPVLGGLLFLVGLAIGIFVLEKDAWWQRLAPTLPGAILFAFTLWTALTRLVPRPIKELAELDRQLP